MGGFEGLGQGVRRERDSNPRYRLLSISVFETDAFNHSAISPSEKRLNENGVLL